MAMVNEYLPTIKAMTGAERVLTAVPTDTPGQAIVRWKTPSGGSGAGGPIVRNTDSTSTGTAYTVTDATIPTVAKGFEMTIIPSLGASSNTCTLSVNGTSGPIRRQVSDKSSAPVNYDVQSIIVGGYPVTVMWDGTNWVATSQQMPSADDLFGPHPPGADSALVGKAGQVVAVNDQETNYRLKALGTAADANTTGSVSSSSTSSEVPTALAVYDALAQLSSGFQLMTGVWYCNITEGIPAASIEDEGRTLFDIPTMKWYTCSVLGSDFEWMVDATQPALTQGQQYYLPVSLRFLNLAETTEPRNGFVLISYDSSTSAWTATPVPSPSPFSADESTLTMAAGVIGAKLKGMTNYQGVTEQVFNGIGADRIVGSRSDSTVKEELLNALSDRAVLTGISRSSLETPAAKTWLDGAYMFLYLTGTTNAPGDTGGLLIARKKDTTPANRFPAEWAFIAMDTKGRTYVGTMASSASTPTWYPMSNMNGVMADTIATAKRTRVKTYPDGSWEVDYREGMSTVINDPYNTSTALSGYVEAKSITIPATLPTGAVRDGMQVTIEAPSGDIIWAVPTSTANTSPAVVSFYLFAPAIHSTAITVGVNIKIWGH
jgi:hypothetical protein